MYDPAMRYAIAFLVAAALFLGGGYALWFLLTSADGFKGWMVMAAAFMWVGGAAWLWADYIAPMLGKGRADF